MVGIGFFAPLPLALMMPFMAGQSMLMGDAFGKAYQYGKRKISAMSNEEFNKLTPQQLGQQIVTDYSAMIPSLSVAIKQSSAFQSLIIQELATIIRSIPKDIIQGFVGSAPNPITSITQEATQPADNIDYGKIAIATLKIMLGPIAGSFNIPGVPEAEARTSSEGLAELRTGEELPDTLQQHIEIQKDLLENEIVQGSTEGPPAPPALSAVALAKAKSLREDEEWRAWSSRLAKLKQSFNKWSKAYLVAKASLANAHSLSRKRNQPAINLYTSRMTQSWSEMFSATSRIRQMSNDYRNPNNNIRQNAIQLRKELQRGNYDRNKFK